MLTNEIHAFYDARKFCAMTDDVYLMLQTGIICFLLALVSTTALIQHPGWFQ
jgi:hypothetical protein